MPACVFAAASISLVICVKYSSYIVKKKFVHQFSFRNGCTDALASIATVKLPQERIVKV